MIRVPPVALQELPTWPVEIDWNQSLADDLRFYIVSDGATMVDLVAGAVAAFSGSPTPLPITDGMAADLDGSDYFEFAHDDDYNLTGELTLIWRGIVDTGSAYRQFCGKHAAAGDTSNPFDFRTDNAASGLLSIVRANHQRQIWWGPAVTLGALKTYGVSQGAAIEVAPTFYADAVPTTGTLLTGVGTGAAAANTSPLRIGRRADGAVQMDGKIVLVAGWARVLHADEHRAFHNDPYGLLVPAVDDAAGLGTGTGGAAAVGVGLTRSVALERRRLAA